MASAGAQVGLRALRVGLSCGVFRNLLDGLTRIFIGARATAGIDRLQQSSCWC